MSTSKLQVEQIIAYLSERGETISVAESLTAGGLANALTNASGSSAVFVGGLTADRKSTRLNSSHSQQSRMPSSA